jgi:DNA-binding response OmpR family regulator
MRRILVVDHQAYWRELVAGALRSAGYPVALSATYDELPHQDYALILLGCASVEGDERLLVARLLACKLPVVVLASCLSAPGLRALFIAGVADAGEKTYDPGELVALVEHTLQRLRTRQRACYPLERAILS